MIGKINTVLKGRRRFRASSIGEFAVALGLSIALGTLMVALVMSATPTPAFGQDATWLGETSSNWNSDTNWSGGVAPVSTNQSAIFDSSTNTFVDALCQCQYPVDYLHHQCETVHNSNRHKYSHAPGCRNRE